MDSTKALKDTASHIVRLYLWSQLERYMGDRWKKVPNGAQGIPTIPIIPAQEQPEFQDSGYPYIVYIYDVHNTGDVYQLESESLSLVIYSQDAGLISATTKLIQRVLNKYDETARDINRWIREDAGLKAMLGPENITSNTIIEELKRYRFKEIHVSGSVGAQPAPGEGGRMDSIITVEILYTEHHNAMGYGH